MDNKISENFIIHISCIEDIILKYLDIFELDSDIVIKGILNLRSELGNKFVYIIGNDMRYLDKILEIEED